MALSAEAIVPAVPGAYSGSVNPAEGDDGETNEFDLFVEWIESQFDSFWTNGLFDYGFFLLDDFSIQFFEVEVQDPEKPDESGTDEKGDPPLPPPQGSTCHKNHTALAQSTMAIVDYPRQPAWDVFKTNKTLFPFANHLVPTPAIAFNELLDATINLADNGNPIEPASWTTRGFRAAADLHLGFAVIDGELGQLKATLKVRGGPEPTPFGFLWGQVRGKITAFDVNPDGATIEYVLYGRPHADAELIFNGATANAKARTSRWIWQHVRVTVTPDECDGYSMGSSILGRSKFPTHSVVLDGAIQPGIEFQGLVTDLWSPLDPNQFPAVVGGNQYVDLKPTSQQPAGYSPPLPPNPESTNGVAYSK